MVERLLPECRVPEFGDLPVPVGAVPAAGDLVTPLEDRVGGSVSGRGGRSMAVTIAGLAAIAHRPGSPFPRPSLRPAEGARTARGSALGRRRQFRRAEDHK